MLRQLRPYYCFIILFNIYMGIIIDLFKRQLLSFSENELFTLQSQEILNRPVFVLEILKCLKILKITQNLFRIFNNVQNLFKIFSNVQNLFRIFSNVQNLFRIFSNVQNLQNLFRIFSNFQNFQNVFRISAMFRLCSESFQNFE